MSDAARAFIAARVDPSWEKDRLDPIKVEHCMILLDAFAAEQTAALRAALDRVHRQMLNHGTLDPGESCFVCDALLADAGQTGEEKR